MAHRHHLCSLNVDFPSNDGEVAVVIDAEPTRVEAVEGDTDDEVEVGVNFS